MESWQWGLLLRPLILLIFLGGIVAPLKWAILKCVKNPRVRRVLLIRLN